MKEIREELKKPYNAQTAEKNIYKTWEDSGYFNPNNLDESHKTPFTVILPPPNVTGTLHTGHAIMLAIQDSIVRYKRMNGFKTLWLPGTDHAAIATQSRVEKDIYKKENKTRHDLGREELLKRVNEFALESQNTILSQFRSMGASLDWSRLAFTLDDARNDAVVAAFKKMYEDGLIYQGERIVNWDPKGQTTISDDEIINEERKGKMYTFKYSADFPITISSTRPETKLGDTAVAVSPDDERYAQYVGKTFNVEFCGEKLEIKIIADEAVEKEFGTGALGVTPSHSKIDWEIADRHNLVRKTIINEYGKLTVGPENIKNKKVELAREEVVKYLRENNLLIKEEDITQNIPTAERTGGVVEPLPKKQWFVAVEKEFDHFGKKITLKKLMIEAVESGKIKILGDRFEKTYFHWIENLKDWCISRQIWYGHRIPVWTNTTGEIKISKNNPGGDDWKQDEDTLDTWFSSGLWTFSTLGWPNKTKDLETFHPTDLMETGYDILFFWVARMILFSTYLLNEVPFKTVYLHGLVRDAQGRKMSKSLGNALDPRELAEKYGTDALRMSLLVGNGVGNDLRLGEDKIKAYKLFANKIWNATRFVLERTNDLEKIIELKDLREEFQVIYKDWQERLSDITSDIENYRLHLATEKIYDYFWKTFADKIIEEQKINLKDDNSDKLLRSESQSLLLHLLREQIITLHPFMPFITEEIWKDIKNSDEDLLMIQPWPKK
jgi:valyl-tRNA synthetase